MKQILILGGGIAGLSAAWFLQQKYGEQAKIILLEKANRVGGYIQTLHLDSFTIELGPHSCRGGNFTQQLIQALHLQDELLPAAPTANSRYLFYQNQLIRLPTSLRELFISPLFKGLKWQLFTELFHSKGIEDDETVSHFIERHFGKQMAERFVDPLVSGIFAGNIDHLSVKACFPLWKEAEHKYGSLIRGMLFSKKQKENSQIFSFKRGMTTLTDTLAERLSHTIALNQTVLSLKYHSASQKIEVCTQEKRFEVDHVISALPWHALAPLLPFQEADLDLYHVPIYAVTLGFKQKVLKHNGFGYLVPTMEKQQILGMIWGSSIFPSHYPRDYDCIRVMMGGAHLKERLSEEEVISRAKQALSDHLKIVVAPELIHIAVHTNAIPQFAIGHLERAAELKKMISAHIPGMTCIGSGFNGVSIEDCIKSAYEAV